MKSHLLFILFAVGVALSLSAEPSLAKELCVPPVDFSANCARPGEPAGCSLFATLGQACEHDIRRVNPRFRDDPRVRVESQYVRPRGQYGCIVSYVNSSGNPETDELGQLAFCPDGSRTDQDQGQCKQQSLCRVDCPNPLHVWDPELLTCACPLGKEDNGSGKCVPVQSCPDGYRLHSAVATCAESDIACLLRPFDRLAMCAESDIACIPGIDACTIFFKEDEKEADEEFGARSSPISVSRVLGLAGALFNADQMVQREFERQRHRQAWRVCVETNTSCEVFDPRAK